MIIDPFDDFGAVTSCNRVAHVNQDELGPLARVGTVAEAVKFGDVVMVVVPYTAMEQIGRDYGNSLAEKVLVQNG
jgi:predicted dinucleotide-binding enzyme